VANAERVARYIADIDRQAFDRAEMARDAVERCIERVCEAAHRLGEHAERLVPGQPWREIRGMGNRLRHADDEIDPDVLWKAATVDLPELAREAKRALKRLSADRDNPR
jgi:uncharacterized protein with HEPN domain